MVLVMLGQDYCLHSGQEELGRHRGREGRNECLLCDAKVLVMCCGIVLHTLVEKMHIVRWEHGDRFDNLCNLDSFCLR